MSISVFHDQPLSLDDFSRIARQKVPVTIDERAMQRVAAARKTLDGFVSEGRVIYGVNTSMGGFVHMLVPTEHAPTLQRNLIHAVATNVGPYLDEASTRATVAARIISLARGNSAISPHNLNVLVQMLNANVLPCIPEKGSLGTSGDLGPLACVALAGCGLWRSSYRGEVMPSSDALAMAGIRPMALSYKEGLALINGTSAMVGVGALVHADAVRLFDRYLGVSSLAVEALGGRTKPFDPRVHALKPHQAQRDVALTMWRALDGSKMAADEAVVEKKLSAEFDGAVKAGAEPIEDAYSIRCTPQVLGPVLDTLRHTGLVLANELNSSNDNPLILPDEDEVFHNGHFHGQYVATAMDHLSIALVTLCNLSDRRTDRMLTAANSNGLPGFLCRENPGLRLGLMGGQFMATSLTAENRSLAVPVSIQTLPSTGGFQDVVSFGLVAARRCREILGNARYVAAFELLCACQAADIRGSQLLSPSGRSLYDWTRRRVPYLDHDTVLTDYLEALASGLTESLH